MRITRNKMLLRKYIDQLSRDVHDSNKRIENLRIAQRLVNILEEEAQLPSVMLKSVSYTHLTLPTSDLV